MRIHTNLSEDKRYALPHDFEKLEGLIPQDCFHRSSSISGPARTAFMTDHGTPIHLEKDNNYKLNEFWELVNEKYAQAGVTPKPLANLPVDKALKNIHNYFQYEPSKIYKYVPSTTTWKIAQMGGRVNVVDGGARAGKTNSIIQLFTSWMHSNPGLICYAGSESLPHLTLGVIEEFRDIMEDWGLWDTAGRHVASSTLNEYRWNNGSRFRFIPLDRPTRARGPTPDFVFINEYNSPLIQLEAFKQFYRRVTRAVYMDCNPDLDTWFDSDILPKAVTLDGNSREKGGYILDHLTEVTYKDNEALTQAQIIGIEADKANPADWLVYGEGKKGSTRDMCFPGWKVIRAYSDVKTVPLTAKLLCRGLDFGGDGGEKGAKMALVAIYSYLGGFIVDQEIWSTNYNLDQVVSFLNKVDEQTTVICDKQQPNDIRRLQREGFSAVPCTKGRGSIAEGIAFIRRQKIFVTATSNGIRHEQRRYRFQKKPDGYLMKQPPLHSQDDAMDAIRYAFEPMMNKERSYDQEIAYADIDEFKPWTG